MRRVLLLALPLAVLLGVLALREGDRTSRAPAALPQHAASAAQGFEAASAPDGSSTAAAEVGLPESARNEVVHDPWAEAGPRASLTGGVFDAVNGAPIPGAHVTLTLGEHGAAVETDADGAFSVDWPEGWAANLEVGHADYVDQRRPTMDLDEPLRVALHRSGRIAGQVLARHDADLAGAVARLWVTHSGRTRGEAVEEVPLEAEGIFAFHDLAAGVYAIGVATSGAPVAYEPTVLVRAGLETQVVVSLELGERLRGQVITRRDRAGVEGATVLARPELQGVGDDVERDAERRTVTAGDGRFELDGLSPGTVEVWIRTPWGALEHEEHAVSADGLPEEATFMVASPAELSGHVLDASGEPVPHAWVALSVAWEARRFRWADVSELLAEEEEKGLRLARADAAGRYDLGQVAARQELQLAAYPPSGESEDFGAFLRKLELSEGEVREVDLKLVPTTTLSGRTIDPEGQPVPGATIELEIAAGRERSFLAETLTDGAGEYHFERVPAIYVHVDADLEGYRNAGTWVDLRSAKEGRAPDLVVRPAFVVRGHVIDTDGWAVPHAAVRVADPSKDDRDRRRARWVSADEYGRFEVDDLREGTYEVEVWAIAHLQPEGSAPQISLPGEPYVILRMDRRRVPTPGTVTGEVVRAATGGPVPGLEIRGARGTVLVEGTRFRVSGVPSGNVRLGARAPGLESLAFDEVFVPEGGTVDVGRYETRGTSHVHVVVRNPAGKALQKAQVRLFRRVEKSRRGVVVPKGYQLDYNSRQGWYEQDGVGRYPWTLDVRHERYGRHSQVITPDGSVVIEVQLPPRGENSGGKEDR